MLKAMLLRESITHIEDLSLNEFIRTVESMKDKVVTEKLDGANLWFGLDEVGFFTSREGKSPKRGRFYSANDYAMSANYNGFRACHLALEQYENVIRKHLIEGDMIEIEVLFGRQPNTVTYGMGGKNFIVVLRGVIGTDQKRVDSLAAALNGKTAKVKSKVISSPDGEKLSTDTVDQAWEFTNVTPIAKDKIDTTEALALLGEMKKFIALKNDTFPNLTNQEVAELNLTSVDKERRDAARAERDLVNKQILAAFKMPIKEMLLHHFVRKVKPMLQDKSVHSAEDLGIEGVVVRDPVTGSQTKIVDKDVFTAVNTFNSTIRSQIGGLVRTTDKDAPVDLRGGAFGEAKIQIANVLGVKELALSSGVKRFFSKFKGGKVTDTAERAAESLNISSPSATGAKIAKILDDAITEIDDLLHKFKREGTEYTLSLKTGKEIGFSPEIMHRTLTAFAETKKDIREIRNRVTKSRTAADLVMAIYGKSIDSLHAGESTEMKESKMPLLASLISEEGDEGTISAADIADQPMRILKNKVVVKRKRNFSSPNKFAPPARSVTEDRSHVVGMKFAADISSTIAGEQDLEFNQLRKDVNNGDMTGTPIISKYLDKAHEINDDVDAVAFGLELDNDTVVKVYVAAAQAEQFEHELSVLLGKESDVEKVISTAAEKFDIVDVEWPANYNNSNDAENVKDDEPEDLGPEPDIDYEVFDDEEVEAEEPDSEEPEDEASDESADDAETKKTDESFTEVRRLLLAMSQLDEDAKNAYSNQAMQTVNELLTLLGIDVTANRSFSYQAHQLQVKNSLGVKAARSSTVLPKLKIALMALARALEKAQIAKNGPVPAVESLMKSMNPPIVEAVGNEWMIADVKSQGFQLSNRGWMIHISNDEAEKLHLAIVAGVKVSVVDKSGTRFIFTPADGGGYNVKIAGTTASPVAMSAHSVEKFVDAVSAT